MYSNEQSRINAVISYFFLGPFMLFAKRETPLGDSYVQIHAKKASKIIAIMIFFCIGYFFIRKYLNIGIPGIGLNVSTIIFAGIIGITIFSLSRGAYYAYLGNIPGEQMNNGLHTLGTIEVTGVYTVQNEEEKSRILASMIPFFGIWVAKKYQLPIMIRGRVLGSLFAFIYIITFLFSTRVGFIPTFVLIAGIVLFVIEGIYLFLFNSFVSWNILDKIPTYHEVESHIKAIGKSIIEFIKVSFGKEKTGSYSENYSNFLQKSHMHEPYAQNYFMPGGLIGIPFWNLFCIPSLFIKKYQPYTEVVLQGLIITSMISFFFFWKREFSSPYLLLLLFPIVHILVYGGSEKNIHTPGIGLITGFFFYLGKAQSSAQDSIGKNTESFKYNTNETSQTGEVSPITK